jgi:hypothetical protein
MFDLRYHVASLAAVFLALVVGILVGVGSSSQGVISTKERDVLNERIAELRNQRDAARAHAGELARAQRWTQTFVKRTYPAVMSGRLASTRIALLFVGGVDGTLRSDVDETLADAGARGLVRFRALKVPIDVPAIDRVLASRRALARYVGDRRLAELGGALGQEFVRGGKTPLWNALSDQLVEERGGSGAPTVDAVVVVRSARPQARGTARLLGGLYDALSGSGAPVVGIETSNSTGGIVETFRKHRLSTVDDVDTPFGRLALAVVLAGGAPGHYGVKPSAEDLLPPVEPVPVPTTSG